MLNLLPASGDLRNVETTVVSMPPSYNRTITMVINDMDLDVVARNLFISLIALTVEDEISAAECMLHLWYSALVRHKDVDLLTTRIRPLIEDVIGKIKSKAPGTVLGKTWQFGRRSLRLVLSKEGWTALLLYLEVPAGLSAERANQIRTSVTLAPEPTDFRERKMVMCTPVQRFCGQHFRRDGILLPLGQSRETFTIPNPTMFQTAEW